MAMVADNTVELFWNESVLKGARYGVLFGAAGSIIDGEI